MSDAELRIDLQRFTVGLLRRVVTACRAGHEPACYPASERRRRDAESGGDAIESRIESARRGQRPGCVEKQRRFARGEPDREIAFAYRVIVLASGGERPRQILVRLERAR